MIIDCHTHIWADAAQLGDGAQEYIKRQGATADVPASAAEHALSARCVDKTLVLGFRCRDGQAGIPNEYIAQYVERSGGAIIGIAGVDPTEPGATAMARDLLDSGHFRGMVISPSTQGFHPCDSRAQELYDLAQDRRVPVFIHNGAFMRTWGRMEYARPYLLDEVARDFPALTLIISGMGYPWVDESIALVGKQPRVFGDLGPLVRRPWQAYNALVLAHQFNVMDKILFGSDFPYYTAAGAIEAVYRLHEITQGTNLPSVPREALRSIIERDSLAALGIARPQDAPPPAQAPSHDEA